MNRQNISVTVDIIILRKREFFWEILLIQRKNDPFRHTWALPGGFVDKNEDLTEAAERELLEETGIKVETLHQIKAFGKPGRDPRGHTVSIAFQGFVSSKKEVTSGDDAENADWFDLKELPDLAFDHSEIISFALSKLLL